VNLITHFNVRLAHIASLGYHKSITAFNLVGAPLQPRVAQAPRSGEERSGRPQFKQQVLRTNRVEMTPKQRAKQDYNRQYLARKKDQARPLVAES
jgi:hypothetical protein